LKRRPFCHKNIISAGNDPLKVYKKAKENGADEPVIFYVPEKESTHIY